MIFTKNDFNIFLNNLRDIDYLIDVRVREPINFPAKIVTILLRRKWSGLGAFKSEASKKRKTVEIQKYLKKRISLDHNLFDIQKVCIELFQNKLTITGSQTKEDLYNIYNIMHLFFNQLFSKKFV